MHTPFLATIILLEEVYMIKIAAAKSKIPLHEDLDIVYKSY